MKGSLLSLPCRSLALAGLTVALAWGAACSGVGADEGGGEHGLPVERHAFERRLVLTGELKARLAEHLVVPRSPQWDQQVQWLIEDGAEVEAGDVLVELDNSLFTSDIEDKRLRMAEQEKELDRMRAEAEATQGDKRFALTERKADLEGAQMRAAVPPEVLPRSEYQDRQLELERARVAVAKAEEDLRVSIESSEADLALQRIELAKGKREIEVAEKAIETLTLRAPSKGIALVAEHPWMRRKIREGDRLWVGAEVVQLPDLSSLEAEAVLWDVDDGQVEPGMVAVATVDAFPSERFEGRVEEVAPMAREVERSSMRRYFRVRVVLDDLDTRRVRPGMSVRVEVTTLAQPDALLIPRAALNLNGPEPQVRLADGEVVAVRLGPCNALACLLEEASGGRLEEGTALAPWGRQPSQGEAL